MTRRTADEVMTDISANQTYLSRADSENVAAQYAARLTQGELDRLKLRRQELFDELADIRNRADLRYPLDMK